MAEVQDQRTSDIGMLLDLVGSPRGIHFGMVPSIVCHFLLALGSHQ